MVVAMRTSKSLLIKFIIVVLISQVTAFGYSGFTGFRRKVFRLGDAQTESEALDFVWNNRDKIEHFRDAVAQKEALVIKELSGGNTNFNYVVHHVGTSGNRLGSVFVKHAKGYAKGFGESASMSTERLRYEFDGINEFACFGFTTLEPYIYDSDKNYLVTQVQIN